MKGLRLILAVSAILTLGFGGAALAAEMGNAAQNRLGPGFHSAEAPMGLRWWLSSRKVALDFGLGFHSDPAFIDPNEKETGYALEFGVPFICHSWDRVNALIRPGILYQSQQVGFDSSPLAGIQFDTETQTTFDIMLEGEAEVFLVDNVSVSAAHGIRFRNTDPGFGADSQTSFGTRGNNFTTIGFHIYLFK